MRAPAMQTHPKILGSLEQALAVAEPTSRNLIDSHRIRLGMEAKAFPRRALSSQLSGFWERIHIALLLNQS